MILHSATLLGAKLVDPMGTCFHKENTTLQSGTLPGVRRGMTTAYSVPQATEPQEPQATAMQGFATKSQEA